MRKSGAQGAGNPRHEENPMHRRTETPDACLTKAPMTKISRLSNSEFAYEGDEIE